MKTRILAYFMQRLGLNLTLREMVLSFEVKAIYEMFVFIYNTDLAQILIILIVLH